MATSPEPALAGERVSVVVPAYNEAQRIGRTLDRILEYLGGAGAWFEVLVVDDGSTDGTRGVVAEATARDPRVRLVALGENRGKGAAVRRGMLEAEGDWVLFSDADLSTPIEEIEKLLAAIRAGHDAAIGSRTVRGASVLVHQPWYRELMGKTFNGIVRLLAVGDYIDTQCGFKLFTKGAARAVFGLARVDRFAFDVEALVVARCQGLRVAEIPIRWVNDPRSSVSIVRDSTRMLLDLFRIRWNAILGRYRARARAAAPQLSR